MLFHAPATKHCLIFTSLLMATPTMASSDIDMLTEDDLLVEIPIVSSVTHMEQTLPQTPASITIIDRQTIQASTAVDINDLFRLVPGFETYYVNGGRKGVTYHALGDDYPRRLEVKIDGRSVYESLFSAVIWSTIGIDLDDIEYIEVVRGANAAADGSNAFLASINIVTRSPLLDAGFSFRTQMGSAQTRNAALTYSGKIGNVDQRTTLSFRSNDGFDDGVFLGQSIAIDDDSEAISLTTKGLWTPSSKDNIEFQFGVADSDLWIGKDEFTNRDMSYQYQYLNWSHLTENGNSLQLIAYHNDLELIDNVEPQKISEVLGVDDSSPLWPLGPVPDTTIFDGDEITQSERWEIEFRTSLKPADKLRAVTGAAVRHDRVSGQIGFDTLDTLSEVSYRAYTNFEWTKSERLILNGGLIVEDRESTGKYASYRIASNYLSSEDHMFRAAFNRSFRAPTLLENNQRAFVRYVNPQECSSGQTSPECNPLFRDLILDASVISDSDIRNEELKSYEIGYAGYFIDRSLNFDMRLYYEQMRDVIAERRDEYPDLDNFVNIRDNTDTMDVRGIEFQAVYEPNQRLLLRGQYSYSDIDGISCYTSPENVGEPCRDYRDLDYRSMKNTLGFLTSYRLDNGVSLSSMVSYNSSKSSFFKGSKLDDFMRIDLKAAKTWEISRSSIDISFTVQNLGDAYAEYNQYNLFETRYILGFKATLP